MRNSRFAGCGPGVFYGNENKIYEVKYTHKRKESGDCVCGSGQFCEPSGMQEFIFLFLYDLHIRCGNVTFVRIF